MLGIATNDCKRPFSARSAPDIRLETRGSHLRGPVEGVDGHLTIYSLARRLWQHHLPCLKTTHVKTARHPARSRQSRTIPFPTQAPPALSPLASLTTLATVSGAADVIPSPPTPTDPDIPAEGGVDISASPPQDVTSTGHGVQKNACPSQDDAVASPPDMKGAKWFYARKWYADSNGTLEAFEAHYKTLSASDRRKLGRVAPS
ncbi:hypothetical protein DICSQDRAFT_173299 [Dichomitus squalens LYAD-421 SS1]|uniref:Uncharacterized protein n=1 Tax=Dichomitus squalens (strain LYAD-421) TaxID=732165 RepID=R7SQ54_DICSQ|nr:uncharacterized protein DICSQDRAFT_173299 [Dichomitus squalens LYAD-421 SS1]EJF58068.1 hypothetical protein DICSQDRAFT_173299 [Dichomitus squalens LYAD-421 SS1]